MARVKTLITHNNPPGVRRNPDDEYDTTDYQYLSDRRIVKMVPISAAPEEEVIAAPEEEVVAAVEEEVVETPVVANKQMGAESQDDVPAEGKRRKYARRDMSAEEG